MIYDHDIHNDTSSLQICPARIIQYIFFQVRNCFSAISLSVFVFAFFFFPMWGPTSYMVCWDLHLLEHASKADAGPCALTGSPYVWGWMMFLCALCKTEMLFVRMWQWEQMNLCLRCSQIHCCKCNRKTYK